MDDKINLLIVDDSPLMRKMLQNLFNPVKQINIVGVAENGFEALEKIETLCPDVVILDVNMPKMDGITALKHIMINRPLPTVMFSTLTKNGATTTFDALKYGAVDFIHKPSNYQSSSVAGQSEIIVNKIKMAAGIEIRSVRYTRANPFKGGKSDTDGPELKCEYICAMGTAEGGYGTLLKIIPNIRPDLPVGFVTVLHEPSMNVDNFTNYLNRNSPCCVKRTKNDEVIKSGTFYMVSTEEDVTVSRDGDTFFLNVEPSNQTTERNTINHLMSSLSSTAGESSVGILLSGSGKDGALGIENIIHRGGMSIVQEPATCLQKELCRQVIQEYDVDIIVPDIRIADEINTVFFL